MTIQFNLQFNISSSVFIATAEKSELSFHHADRFCKTSYGILDRVGPDDVERYVNEHCHEDLRVGLAERLMNHLLLCHNVSVFDAERRGW
jgi:hypothetical protein